MQKIIIMEIKKNWIKEGLEVAHKDKLGVKMYVDEIIIQYNEQHEQTENGDMQKVKKPKIKGVKVHWWEGDVMRVHRLHTNLLVPWEVAEDGFIATLEFFNKLSKL